MAIVKQPQFVEEIPPKRTYKPDPLRSIMDDLVNHKDQWALIATGEKAGFKVKMDYHYPDFEFAMRTEDPDAKPEDPKWSCYARYRGAEYLAEKLHRKAERKKDSNEHPEEQPA